MNLRDGAVSIVAALAVCASAALAGCGDPAPTPAPVKTPEPTPVPVAKPASTQFRYDIDAMPKLDFIGPRGTGETLADGDIALIHYIAWAITPGGDRKIGGTVDATWAGGTRPFDPLPTDPDARAEAPRPFVAEVGRAHLVEGLDRTLQGLKVGDHLTSLVPSQLAYGDRGFGSQVPGRTDIRYEIWVIERVPPLHYEMLRKGEGEQAVRLRKAVVHIVSRLPDGTLVDDTHAPKPTAPDGVAVSITVYGGEVMEALDRVLPKLRVGDYIRMTVPWALDRGPAPRSYGDVKIPAMTNLTYEIEFLGQTTE